MNTQNIGSFIQTCRKTKGLTQVQLGDIVGVSDKAVSKWERGLSLPDVSILPNIADALGVSLTEIIKGEYMEKELNEGIVEQVIEQTFAYSKQTYKSGLKKNLSTIILLVFLLVSFICLIVNISVSRSVDWSLYPIFGMLVVVLPTMIGISSIQNKITWMIGITSASIMGLLLLIEYLTNTSGWAIRIGFPICLASMGTAYLISEVIKRQKNRWYASAIILVNIACLIPVIDFVLYLNRINDGVTYTNILSIPFCLVIALALFIRGKANGSEKSIES